MRSTGTASSRPRVLATDARYNIELALDAAEACLTRDTDARMSDIAAEAGLGRLTIYGHFASRQVCDRGVGPPRLGH
jgi:AcrR family transcriptional regulator